MSLLAWFYSYSLEDSWTAVSLAYSSCHSCDAQSGPVFLGMVLHRASSFLGLGQRAVSRRLGDMSVGSLSLIKGCRSESVSWGRKELVLITVLCCKVCQQVHHR